MDKEKLNRINELARKKRSVGLNNEEISEQKKLYEEYLAGIRGQVINLLESIEIVDATDKSKKNEPEKKNITSFQQTHVILGQRILH
ncbi:MAG: DUF896 domain-containing protein [Selenomonadaceae bacterium]|nr:DUF896 domain-containing protein [Selenomonadaceae bacterium]